MKAAHQDLGLQDADLNALIEDLQAAMDREGVPFAAQNRLLAKLAPMRKDVVVR
jgi:hemoglobin